MTSKKPGGSGGGQRLAYYGATVVNTQDDDEDNNKNNINENNIRGEGAANYDEDGNIVIGSGSTGAGTETEPWVKKQKHHRGGLDTEPDEEQPRFRDVTFSILFGLHLLAMLYLGVRYGSFGADNSQQQQQAQDQDQYDNEEEMERMAMHLRRIVLHIIAPCCAVSFVLAYIATAIVIPSCTTVMISSCLLASIASTIVLAFFICLQAPYIFTFLAVIAMVAIVTYYVKIVWRLIPFASINLEVSLRGMSDNWGMYLVALVFSGIGFAWIIAWIYVANGVLSYESITTTDQESKEGGEEEAPMKCDENDEECIDNYYGQGQQGIVWFTLFLLLVSLYWTSTVLLNTVQVTVAGVMGTWCFAKEEASTCCSPAVFNSLYRSVTYSFGSICMGSLLEAVITALRVLVNIARNNQSRDNDQCGGGGAILLCILECILRFLEDIIDYFNQWAYVFVGIYGYSYLESGRGVIELFRARGWTAIITNDLVGYVLNFTAVTVGICSGFVAVLLSLTKSLYLFGNLEHPRYWAFSIGLVVGIAIAAVVMNVIKGAVNTLIVCFADAPAKLEENHPDATRKMAAAWVSVFPECGIRVLSSQAAYNVEV